MSLVKLQQLQAKVALREEQIRLRRDHGVRCYKPRPEQNRFHAAANFRRRYVRTGNRWGKSTCGASEDIAYARGAREWCDPSDPLYSLGIPQRSTKGCIIVADWDKAHEVFTNQVEGASQGKLFKLLPKDSIHKILKDQQGHICEIQVKSIHGGISSIHLDTVKSYVNNPMSHESVHWDWVHIDEPCPEGMFVAYARGLTDTRGSAWFTCTSIEEFWINEYFLPRGEQDKPHPDGYVNEEKRSRWMMTGDTRDNFYLDPESIEDFMEDLTEEQREARIEGRPLNMTGRIYKEFRDNEAVFWDTPKGWKAQDEPPMDYTIRYSIDVHPITPHAVLFAATSPFEQTFFWSEIFQATDIDELCELIEERMKGRRAERIICDPLAWQEDPNDGSCMADEFYANGIYPDKAPKDLARGILKTQKALKRDLPNGYPALMFSSLLSETRYEFDRYVYDPKNPGKISSKIPDHMMENLYRLVLGGLHYVKPDESIRPVIRRPSWSTPDLRIPQLGTKRKPKLNLKLRYR